MHHHVAHMTCPQRVERRVSVFGLGDWYAKPNGTALITRSLRLFKGEPAIALEIRT